MKQQYYSILLSKQIFWRQNVNFGFPEEKNTVNQQDKKIQTEINQKDITTAFDAFHHSIY